MIAFLADCIGIAGKNIIGLIVIAIAAICGMTLADELRRWLARR